LRRGHKPGQLVKHGFHVGASPLRAYGKASDPGGGRGGRLRACSYLGASVTTRGGLIRRRVTDMWTTKNRKRCLEYTGRAANVVASAALDPERTLDRLRGSLALN
jgi:hypothetical protein